MLRLLSVLILTVGCVTLPEKLQEKVHLGDGYREVKEELGTPDELVRVGDYEAFMVYRSNEHVCSIHINQYAIVGGTECKENSNYVNPYLHTLAAVLQGAGQGLMQARNSTVTCTDLGDGYFTCYGNGHAYNCNTYGNTTQCH